MVYLMAQMRQSCVQISWGIWVWGVGGGGECAIGQPLCSTYNRHKMHTFGKKEAISNLNIHLHFVGKLYHFLLHGGDWRFQILFKVWHVWCKLTNEKRSKQFQNSYKCHTSKYAYHPTMSVFHWAWLISWIWALI